MQASVLVSPQLDEELAEKGVEDLKHLANHMSKQVCHMSAPCSAATGVQAAMMQPESSPGPDVCMLVFWLSCEHSLQGLCRCHHWQKPASFCCSCLSVIVQRLNALALHVPWVSAAVLGHWPVISSVTTKCPIRLAIVD